MSKRNSEYDFQWCPGCGDFGVRRAIESAVTARLEATGEAIENTVVVAGIGCSGNMVHLMEGPQPFGIHGIHGRGLPIALGVKMANPTLNVIVVAGDGDFLSIGAEHIGPQAKRNLNITAVIMDNAVYGLTKGQSSPTTDFGVVTSTTPQGKLEASLNPLDLYLTLGVSFVANAYSSKVKELSSYIQQAMAYPGMAIVHVQSPCTTYNDTHELLRGNPKKGIEPLAWDIPEDHDPADLAAAHALAIAKGEPMGILYKDPNSVPLERQFSQARDKAGSKSAADLLATFKI